jgi:hypothetical protein
MEMKDDFGIGAGRHGHMNLVPAIAAAVVLGFVVLFAAVVLLLQSIGHWPRPDIRSTTPALPSFGDGSMLSPLLLGAILLVLVGIFVLLMVLVFCVCGCKGGSGIPLPGLPDLGKLATILRGIATALRDGATKIDTANTIVDDARGKLQTVTSFKVRVPKFKSVPNTHVEVPLIYSGPVIVPDGDEEKSLFDDDTTTKLTAFANDVSGKSALDAASGMLRDKADALEGQANALDSHP